MRFIPVLICKNPVKSKLIQALLSLALTFTMVLPAAAETADVSGSATESTTQTIDIYVTKAASFTVKVPVSITLAQSNGTGTADYSIYIKGDVENGSSITVGLQTDTINFKKTKGNTATTLTGSITQAETTVDAADISTAYPAAGQLTGSIQVSGLTAGSWKAQMEFDISYTAPEGNTPLHATALMDMAAVQTAANNASTLAFVTKASAPDGTTSSVDVSAAKDGSVMAHTLSDGSVVIGADGGVLAPEDMTSAFEYFTATNIDVSGLDVRNVTSMNKMFNACSNLTSLDLSSWDTANVIDTSYMFQNNMKLESLILNDLDITKITKFNRMFTNCNLITIYTPNPDFEVWAQKTNRFPTTGKVVVVSPS